MPYYSAALLQDLNPPGAVVFGCAASGPVSLCHVPSSPSASSPIAPAVAPRHYPTLVIPGCLTPGGPAVLPSTSLGPANSGAIVPKASVYMSTILSPIATL